MSKLNGYREVRDNVFYAEAKTPCVGDDEILALYEIAKTHPRKRARICFHQNSESVIQEMLVVFARGIYFRPIRQNLKRTISYQVASGVAEFIEYDEQGNIAGHYKVGAAGSGYPCFFKVKASTFRSFDVLSEHFTFYEVNEGPFVDNMTEYPYWSLPETDNGNDRIVKAGLLNKKLNLDEFAIRPATEGDYDDLYELQEYSMRKHIERVYGWDEARQRKLFKERYHTENNWIIESDDKLIGAICFYWEKDHYFLDNISIHQDFQNQGLGQKLITRLLDNAPVRLQVYKGSEANRFYSRLGFEKIEEKPNHNLYLKP